ncbi:MAG: ABC transporter permease [Acetivibrionales bacterium]
MKINGGTIKKESIKELLSRNAIWVVLIVLVIIMSIANPKFLTVNNLYTLLTGEATKGILAFGIMFAICSRGNDLSAGAVVALVGAISAALVQPASHSSKILSFGPLPSWSAILIGLSLGALIGCINGSLIAYTKMPAFIATLGTQLICRSSAKLFANRPGFEFAKQLQVFWFRQNRRIPGNHHLLFCNVSHCRLLANADTIWEKRVCHWWK